MVATTILADWELNQPTGDDEIDELLSEARKLTSQDLQIVVTHNEDRRLFSKNRVWDTWQLYSYCGGMLPWQVMMCAFNRETVFAYLCGMVNGSMKKEK